MELGLEQVLQVNLLNNYLSFYPCFNGIRVGTNVEELSEAIEDVVSILVLMELGLEHRC